jgi:hypothetical protein
MLLCEAHNETDRESFLDAVIAALPAGPVWCVLRHYDSELIRSLQRRDFEVYGTQVLLTKELAVRVKLKSRERQKKPSLIPAGIARSVAAQQPVTLRVLQQQTQRPRSDP